MVKGKSQLPIVLSDCYVCAVANTYLSIHPPPREQINKCYFMSTFERIISGFKQSPRHIVMV